MAANYSCLLFDVDGTLLDFAASESIALADTLKAFGLPATEDVTAAYSAINQGLWEQLEKGQIKKDQLMKRRFSDLLAQLGAQGNPIEMNNDYMTRISSLAIAYPGAQELLSELAEFCTLATASNGVYKSQMQRLEKSGLLPYFDEVFVSEKVGVAKPAARFFDIAMRRLGIKNRARVLMIGDSLTADVKGGQNAKIDTCWLNHSGVANTTDIQPTYTVRSYPEVKLVAVGEEELQLAATREKRHMV